MGFRDKSGIDLENEVDPIYPATTAYFDRLYGPRHWSPPATTLNFSIGQGENTQTLVNMMRFYEGLAGDGNAAPPLHRAPGRRPSRAPSGSRRRSSTGSGARSSPWSSGAPRRRAATRTWPWPGRPAPRRTRTARTTAGSSGSRRRRSRSWWSAGSWSSPSTARRWRRTSSARSGRYILGPDTAGTIKVKILLDETVAPARTPRPASGGARSRLRRGAGAGRQRCAAARASREDRRRSTGGSCWVSLGLMIFGLLTLYSAGQTDVPTHAAGVWYRQFFWFGHRHRGGVGGVPRLAPAARVARPGAVRRSASSLLVLVLVVGTGAGTAQSSHSWLSIGGHQIGQPSELAKVATVLMLARYLSSRKEPPRSLRDLLVPGLIVGRAVPPGAQAARSGQRDRVHRDRVRHAVLGRRSAAAPVPARLAGPEPAARVQQLGLGRVDGGVHRRCSSSGGPYISDALLVWFLNVAMGDDRAAALEAAGALPAEPAAHLSQSRGGPAGGRATTPSSRGWRSARAAGSAPATPRARRSGWPSCRSSTPTSSSRSWARSSASSASWWRSLSSWRSSSACSGSPGGRPTPSAAWWSFGILGLFFTHVFENVGMTVNLMPITGIPLPFFSYGGSFFMICCALPRARLPGRLGLQASQAILISSNDLDHGVWRSGRRDARDCMAFRCRLASSHPTDTPTSYGRDGMV